MLSTSLSSHLPRGRGWLRDQEPPTNRARYYYRRLSPNHSSADDLCQVKSECCGTSLANDRSWSIGECCLDRPGFQFQSALPKTLIWIVNYLRSLTSKQKNQAVHNQFILPVVSTAAHDLSTNHQRLPLLGSVVCSKIYQSVGVQDVSGESYCMSNDRC